MSRAVIDHSNGTALDALDSIADATTEQHDTAARVMKQHGAADLLEYLFGEPRREGERPALRRQRAEERDRAAVNGAAVATDPSRSQHPPEDIGAWRAVVAAWGRENGWPDAYSRHALDAELVTAWRVAHPEATP